MCLKIGSKKGSGDCFQQTDFLIQQQNMSQEPAGICKTTGTGLHLVVKAKGYGIGLKGMNNFPRAWFQPDETNI